MPSSDHNRDHAAIKCLFDFSRCPQVDCSGYLIAALQLNRVTSPLVGGKVRITADILLSMWQQLPDGKFDLLRARRVEIASLEVMDGGNYERPFQKSYNGSELFQVQSGRTYLLTVSSVITIKTDFLPLNPDVSSDPDFFKVRGLMTCKIPTIRVRVNNINAY